MTSNTKQTAREFTAANGKTVRVGQVYRDNRTGNVRTLRVDAIETDRWSTTVVCTVTHQDHGDGRTTEPMRPTGMKPDRITGRSFVLVDEAPAGGAR